MKCRAGCIWMHVYLLQAIRRNSRLSAGVNQAESDRVLKVSRESAMKPKECDCNPPGGREWLCEDGDALPKHQLNRHR